MPTITRDEVDFVEYNDPNEACCEADRYESSISLLSETPGLNYTEMSYCDDLDDTTEFTCTVNVVEFLEYSDEFNPENDDDDDDDENDGEQDEQDAITLMRAAADAETLIREALENDTEKIENAIESLLEGEYSGVLDVDVDRVSVDAESETAEVVFTVDVPPFYYRRFS